MTLQEIAKLYGRSPQANALFDLLKKKSVHSVFLQGLVCSSASVFFGSLQAKMKRTVLFVLNDADEAGYFYHDLTQMLGQESAFFFPSSYRRAIKYGQRDAANEILRTEVLARLSAGKQIYIVSYPDALAELVVSKQILDERILKLTVGQQTAQVDIVHQLRDFGLQETDYVYEPGQFAVRGSILDVYSYSCEYPFRIDFFGDEIDTIRTFSIEDQLSKDKRDAIEIVPELAAEQSVKQCFLHFLDADALVVMNDYTLLHDRIEQIYKDGFSTQSLTEQLEGATEMEAEKIRREMKAELNLVSASDFQHALVEHVRIEFGKQSEGDVARKQEHLLTAKGDNQALIAFDMVPQPLFHKNFNLLAQTLEDYQLQGYTLYILADSQKQQERLKDIFDSEELKRYQIRFTPVEKTIHEGFVDHEKHACFFTDHQIFDRFHKYNLRSDSARAGKMALTMKELQEMDYGDFIVHVDYGIGKFGGLVRVPTGDSYQEMIRIVYKNNDKVDVSIHSLYKISKYRRSDTGEPPRLSTLGTGAWDRLKEKAKKRIKDIARDLIKLYAQRRREKGFAYSADSYLQHELEASFLYEDTPDQSKATADVKKDMESGRPMDRLVCGDVGFGKTEVAIRAAFKAACDGKQVAVLVPTTVLAYQHYQTFKHRLEGLPVSLEYLSRARTAKDTRRILEELKEGKVDILIGTHKLISKSVQWHDLGLLIIDEEQKFGVSTKEKLRQLKVNVDTLTMSATPIPRTLQFSLMGARDMSIMRTPPPNRYPIQTEVITFDKSVIADAINFEMSRNGQVFFVCDRIAKLTELKLLIEKLVPDCRIAIGHGQMKPEELEKIIMGFINYDYDLLLSTTIVENGIDISNANTIIVNDAHRFGLSDLHQMRGRVGRSNKKAFCYLIAPAKIYLSQESRRRLEALETFSDLGSGFNLAMQDLDIRGAGNLLGSEQSGFMEDLGYETYQKILSQAVTELKNEEFNDLYQQEMDEGKQLTGDDFVDDCAVESDLETYFPDTYVPGSSERMLLYRELDHLQSEEEVAEFRKRMIDRFGPVPREADELMCVVGLRRLGKSLGCEKIMLKQGTMQLQFVSNVNSPFYRSEMFSRVLAYATTHIQDCSLKEKNNKRYLRIRDMKSVEQAKNLLSFISQIKVND
ncbi:transcription-repair coupling factor [Prevotella copri]|uniref:Transcription-repair-coupling factor n=1 Tax=Segatella copri TaxID=165179 RepID=A0AAP3BEC4_9BACT|nr:transcription-repair coupling factor [Segatella copri]MCW4413906.1 transcription-repair coupling factor [Segatella copri]MCW4420758.1 transcription-repair coupling factor [Segatella copri]